MKVKHLEESTTNSTFYTFGKSHTSVYMRVSRDFYRHTNNERKKKTEKLSRHF